MEMESTGQFGRDQLFDDTNQSKQVQENLGLSPGTSGGEFSMTQDQLADDPNISETVEAGEAIRRM